MRPPAGVVSPKAASAMSEGARQDADASTAAAAALTPLLARSLDPSISFTALFQICQRPSHTDTSSSTRRYRRHELRRSRRPR